MNASRWDLFDGVVPFVATAEARSFRRAARTLRVTTSTISKSIARLEADVGVRLLNRSSRSVSLTSEGEAFLVACRDAVGQMEGARDFLSAEQSAPRGVLRVSLPSTFARAVVAELQSLLLEYRSLLVEVLLTDRFVQLSDENIDVALRIGDTPDSSSVRYPIRTLRIVTAASPAYLENHGVPRVPGDLARHNCLQFLLPNGLARDWAFSKRGRRPQFAVRGNFRADQGEPLLAAALSGIGLVQAPDIMLSAELLRGELVEVLGDYSAPGPQLTALCAPGRQRSPKVRALIDLVKRSCAEKPATRARSPASPRPKTR
jgi:LysR family transcriptional regulator, regulator for bpeEF and oprC